MSAVAFSMTQIRTLHFRGSLAVLTLAVIAVANGYFASNASAQYSQRPGAYIRGSSGVGINLQGGSVHIPGRSVHKLSGQYNAIGNGYYQNPNSGATYNPYTGSYLQGSRSGFSQVEQRPNLYLRGPAGGGFNPLTGSVHVPGQAVYKPNGTYHAIGGGYYRDPVSGNTYNPNSGTYLRNW